MKYLYSFASLLLLFFNTTIVDTKEILNDNKFHPPETEAEKALDRILKLDQELGHDGCKHNKLSAFVVGDYNREGSSFKLTKEEIKLYKSMFTEGF